MFNPFKNQTRCDQFDSSDNATYRFQKRSAEAADLDAGRECSGVFLIRAIADEPSPITPPRYEVRFRAWTSYRLEVSAGTAEAAIAKARLEASDGMWKLDSLDTGMDAFEATPMFERRSAKRNGF